ncbi:hypothetical protein PG2083B_0511 [Bifidobacterium pseudolongum subsp. globosum]|uniref:hypothetical protein n=1 Tax=Bifidobacterium pseudolongum TaxID=1694 RepID=UPI001022383F|nr:hypothetical protein [Bifidobacterium pseudolongum]RYQ18372.1 hypothetical protein PG2083B_0511 [Bifidobacterium pseudolongum subsp. globosum]
MEYTVWTQDQAAEDPAHGADVEFDDVTIVGTVDCEDYSRFGGSVFPALNEPEDSAHVCEWSGETCAQTPEFYVLAFCPDPDCTVRHCTYWCREHYAYTLKNILCHFNECEELAQAETDEERAQVVASHVCAFGRIR